MRDVLIRSGYQTSGRIPLIAEGRLVGLLGLADRHRRELAADEIALSAAIGQQMGAFIHHADLYETTQHQLAERTAMMAEIMRRDRELAVYNAIGIAAERSLDLQERLPLAVEAALAAIGAEAGALYLLEPDGEGLTLVAGFGYSSDIASVAGTMTREEGVSGLSLAKGEVVTVKSEDYPSPRLKAMLEAGRLSDRCRCSTRHRGSRNRHVRDSAGDTSENLRRTKSRYLPVSAASSRC